MVLADKLDRLGVRRLLLAIHDVSFPSDADEDLGRGSPATKAAGRFMRFAKGLGFTGLQLGPPGQTSRDNPSPYDATIFSRNLATISVAAYTGLVDEDMIARALVRGATNHVHAYDASHALVAAAHVAMANGARPDLQAELDAFRAEHGGWLASDALYAAIAAAHGGAAHRDWPAAERDLWKTSSPLDRRVAANLGRAIAFFDQLAAPTEAVIASRANAVAQLEAIAAGSLGAQVATLVELHATAIDRYSFGQFLAHREHARVRREAEHLGLALYGDLAVGYADADAWAYNAAFLRGYRIGAPPSRTNPAGQPWGYPVLDPDQTIGRAGELLRARAHKAFAEYDSMRIDHPHGLICPWVYKTGSGDDGQAVRDGARLFESPDLAELATYALVGLEQLDHAQARYADAWVKELSEDQAYAYTAKLRPLVAAAEAHGRRAADLSFEVLSTLPRPLGAVLEAYGCGRWRIGQKANLNDASDVYRMENAQRTDWVMLGNHDTPPIFGLIRAWPTATREAWGRHLTARLALARPWRLADPGFLANAMLAELFASRAENVSIFFADLFGSHERFNSPGMIDPEANWSLRLPSDFAEMYAERREVGGALDLELATDLALAAPKL
ncbi:hypothetical protein BH11MYX1_BH11MYX1_08760 [soil metagenome]